jgi:hypothetical protein
MSTDEQRKWSYWKEKARPLYVKFHRGSTLHNPNVRTPRCKVDVETWRMTSGPSHGSSRCFRTGERRADISLIDYGPIEEQQTSSRRHVVPLRFDRVSERYVCVAVASV